MKQSNITKFLYPVLCLVLVFLVVFSTGCETTDKEDDWEMTASILGNISSEDLEDISEEFGDISEEFDEISIELSMDMEMYDYNEPVDIVLPAEAQNAMDMGGIGF